MRPVRGGIVPRVRVLDLINPRYMSSTTAEFFLCGPVENHMLCTAVSRHTNRHSPKCPTNHFVLLPSIGQCGNDGSPVQL